MTTTSLFDTGIRPAMDAWLLAKSKEVRSYGDYWSASSAGYCQRKIIFERLGVPHVETEADGRKQRIFTSGHLFHAWAQDITKQAGLSVASEVELKDEELKIIGHFDDLVLINKKLILYDYKTVNSKSFAYKRDKMSHYHKLQLGTYMYMLRTMNLSWAQKAPKMELTEARILNISKDDLRMSEQQLLWDAQLESDVLSYWNSLNAHWQAKTLPQCTCADQENGFMSKEKWNPFWFKGQPCSLEWYKLKKAEGVI